MRQERVQLLRRHWFIQDSGSPIKEVEGEGVIGQTPIIEPGEQFEYNSWTEMRTTSEGATSYTRQQVD